MVPLYAARIEDLGPGDFVRVECAASGKHSSGNVRNCVRLVRNCLQEGIAVIDQQIMIKAYHMHRKK